MLNIYRMLCKAATNLRDEENEDVVKGFGMAIALFKLGMAKHPQINEMLDNVVLRKKLKDLEEQVEVLNGKLIKARQSPDYKIVNLGESYENNYNLISLSIQGNNIKFATKATEEIVTSVQERVLKKVVDKYGLIFTPRNLLTMYINVLNGNGHKTKEI